LPSVFPQEERRLVTALFCDLVGFTALSEQLDPEDVREVQAGYFSAMSSQIERYGGIVEKYAGDAVLALFGVPIASEDDAERAVLCALGMQHAIQPVADEVRRRYGAVVAIRVGVNTGEAVSGSWDASGQQQAAVTGDAINVAARLQAAGEPGGVLVGEETMRLTRRRIRFGERQELRLRGKADPVPAYSVLRIRQQVGERWNEGERAGYATPLVGRKRELETIRTAWTRAVAGEGQLLTLVGQPGVGKSRVVMEGIERLSAEGTRPPRLLRGRCLSYGQNVSLWLVANLLRSLCSLPEDSEREAVRGRITATVEEVLAGSDQTDQAIARDVLGEVLGLPPGDSLVAQAGPQIRRSSLIRVLGLVLESLAETGLLLLVLEDLHWLDTASGEILEALLMEVPGRCILVLATERPGWSAPWSGWDSTERLTLHPLPDDDAAALAGAVLGGGRPSPQLEAHLHDRAEGNPFFVEELVRYLQEIGALEQRLGEVRLRPGVIERLPATLAEVLLVRLDRLERQVKTLAQVGSVIGRAFAVRLLARVMEREEAVLTDSLRSLLEADITYPQLAGELQHVFRHALLRDAAYSMLLRKRQRALHLAVGRAMARLYPTDEYVEIIAYHYARTEEHEEAAEWLEKAGDRARATFASEAAIAHYQGALERLERSGGETARQARLEDKLGFMLNQGGRYGEAEEVQRRALQHYEEAGDLEGAGSVTGFLSNSLEYQGRLEEQLLLLETMAVRLAERGPSPAAVQLQFYLVGAFQWQRRYGEMLAAAERAVELARAIGDERWRGGALERWGAALLLLGRVAESHEALTEAGALAETQNDLRLLSSAVASLAENRRVAGALDEALRRNEQALELSIRVGLTHRQMFDHLNRAEILTVTGQWENARAHLARAEEIAARRGTAAWTAPISLYHRGGLALREGNWRAAQGLFERAVQLARGANPEYLEYARAAGAELAIQEGRAEEARDRLQELVDQEGVNLPLLLPVLAWARLELGEAERALELAEEAEREARRRQTLLYLPEGLRIRGMALSRLGRTTEARSVLAEGRERAAAMPNPFTAARILVELGLLDRREGKEDRAKEHWEEALTIFRRLGARKDIERTEQELAERAGG
jgi:class 3 adenylate cyclase/tetratricopeptide (TPR) repeat protein